MLRHRSFWLILFITAIVGLGTLLSEDDDYPMQLHVRWEGFDTARNAVIYADSAILVTVNSNGFRAIARHYKSPHLTYVIHAHGDTVVNVNKLLLDNIMKDFQFSGVHSVVSATDRLTLRIAPREGKAFRPQLRDVDFLFEGQHGLSGDPRMEPDTVWLYGTRQSLDRIDNLHTLPATIEGLSDTTICTLPLDPVWQAYPDLRVSTPSVTLTVPVEKFSEKTLSVPVQFVCADNQVRARLYPERVDVTLWVSDQNYDRLLADMVEATVDYDPALAGTTLPVRVVAFPAFARVKAVSPTDLQYVVIQ